MERASSVSEPVSSNDPARYGLRGFWVDEELPVHIDPTGSPLEAELVLAELEAACEVWNALGLIRLRVAAEDEEPFVRISWQRARHGECAPFGIDSSVAHTGPLRKGMFVHLDSGRTWSLTGDDGHVSLAQALRHELGHVLGLAHSPDPGALLHIDPQTSLVTRSDRAGLETLYGGGQFDPDDLVVLESEAAATPLTTLHGLAPPGQTEFELFDTDGDGKDELLLWRTDPAGVGEFVAFHFAAGPRPERSTAWLPGIVDALAETRLHRLPGGERVLEVRYPPPADGSDPTRVLRAFDDKGRLAPFQGELELDSTPYTRRRSGDLDGDGRLEHVRRSPQAWLGQSAGR